MYKHEIILACLIAAWIIAFVFTGDFVFLFFGFIQWLLWFTDILWLVVHKKYWIKGY